MSFISASFKTRYARAEAAEPMILVSTYENIHGKISKFDKRYQLASTTHSFIHRSHSLPTMIGGSVWPRSLLLSRSFRA